MDNKYTGFFGSSGLPIISLSSYVPVGVYGYWKNSLGGPMMVRSYAPGDGANVVVDWEARAYQLLNYKDGDKFEINTPTGSGKSTVFPLAIAKRMMYRNQHNGLILVGNPLRAVPPGLTSYMRKVIEQDGMSGSISVHYMVGKDSSATQANIIRDSRTKLVILHMSYGRMWAEITRLSRTGRRWLCRSTSTHAFSVWP